MLTLAREARAMTQTDLAEAICVTQGKISKYENGMLLVAEDDLKKISQVLNYTPELFYQQDKVYGLGSSFLFHRQRKDVPMLVQRQIQAEVNILRMQVDRLLRAAEIEVENAFTALDPDAHGGQVEKIAAFVRAAWRLPLGAVADVTAAIESAGGIVMKCTFGTPLIDAAHLWLPAMPPLFFVNKDLPGDRLRWTLAHEIGHAVMHRTPNDDTEEQANRFASEFLMPGEEIGPSLEGMTLRKAAILKGEWKASMAAIIRRARDLGSIGEKKYRSLYTELSSQGYRMQEPFPVDVEEPRLIRQMVDFHRTDLGYDDFELAKLLFMPDPQFFPAGAKESPAILRMNDVPFFAFFSNVRSRPFRGSGASG
jgi:Zn-dependent peptidase ImmA (M78 family)/DNA-binding XRE family transcriptional regulator